MYLTEDNFYRDVVSGLLAGRNKVDLSKLIIYVLGQSAYI